MSRPTRLHQFALLSLLALPLNALTGQTPPALADSLLVSSKWLAARLGDPNLVLLQLGRDSKAFLTGHIPGARFMSLGSIVTDRHGIPHELPALARLERALEGAGISADSRVVLYGDPLAAARMFFTLDYLGMGGRVAILDGGLVGWRAEGRPMSREVPAPVLGDFAPRVTPGVLVDADWVRARMDDPGVLLLDARSPEEWSGQEAGEGVLRPGHIPGAANVYWRRALTAREAARFESPAVLAELLAQAEVSPDKTLVTYCRIGGQASLIYFVARYLGYQPRMYDGSMVEWSRRPDLPVARPVMDAVGSH